MTSEVQQVSTPSEQASKSGLSAAKITLIGTIITATVTAAVAVGGWVLGDSKPSVTHDVGGSVVQSSPLGSVEKVASNESGSEVTVTGWAANGVDDVVVLVGPKSSDGQFWVANASVTDQRWDVVVETDPKVAPGYSVAAYFNRGITPAVATKPLDFTTQTSPPPTPPANPADITQCAVLYGDRCFTDSSWGPPAIYKPNA
jgi:hypothetical protein